jgi:hypothetical protein
MKFPAVSTQALEPECVREVGRGLPAISGEGFTYPNSIDDMWASRGFGSGTGVTSGGPGLVDDLKAQDFSRVTAQRGNPL